MITVSFDAISSTQSQPGNVTINTATASATTENGHPISPDSDSDVVEVYHPGLQVEKTVDLGRVAPNQLVTFTIAVTNTGDIDLYPIVVTDTMQPGLTYIPGTATPLPSIVNGQELVWLDVTGGVPLPPGNSAQITFVSQVTTTPGTYLNSITTQGRHPTGVVTDTDDIPVFVEDPSVDVQKNVTTPEAVNGIITFTIQIANIGPSTLDVVPLLDQFTGPVAYIGGTPQADVIDNVAQSVGWNDLTQSGPSGFGQDLAPGESFVITTVFQIRAETETFSMTNTAIVRDAEDIYDNLTDEHRDDVSITDVSTSVELLYFRASPRDDSVLLEWATAVEVDNYGFYLLRSTTGNLETADELAFVPAAGYGRGMGATYRYRDLTAQADTLYTYWLVDVDTSGWRTVHPPVTTMTLPHGGQPYRIYLPIVLRR
jgi:uncharacterized repeat protein (TIGR01451 family)